MSVFQDADDLYATIGELMDRAKKDPKIGQKIAKANVIIQFRYTDPEAVTTINAKGNPSQPGAYVDVIHGPCPLTPDVEMSMQADLAHQFWHGKVNLMSALSKKQIKTKGPLPKILKLLPAVQPLYKVYPDLLRELGQEHLALK